MTTPNKLADALAAPPAQGEWVLVPREPTEAMIEAGNNAAHAGGCDLWQLKREVMNAWPAMLAAAPQPAPAPVQAVPDAVRELPGKWRKNATELGRSSDPKGIWNDTLLTCAHELESALASQQQSRNAMTPADERIGGWLSAALDDDRVCEAMKADIRNWLASFDSSFDSQQEKK